MPLRSRRSGSESISKQPALATRLVFITSLGLGHSGRQHGAFLHRLAGLVATVEGVDLPVVKAHLSDQLAVVLARGAGRALRHRRRSAGAPGPVAGLLLEP